MQPFIGFVMMEKTYIYQVYFVNPSSTSFSQVIRLAGNVCGQTRGILDTTKTLERLGPLPSMSVMLLEQSEWDRLDTPMWASFELYTREHGRTPHQVYFELPRYGIGYHNHITHLPVLQTNGMKIHLISQTLPGENGIQIAAA